MDDQCEKITGYKAQKLFDPDLTNSSFRSYLSFGKDPNLSSDNSIRVL